MDVCGGYVDMRQYPWRPEEGVKSSGAGVTGGCKCPYCGDWKPNGSSAVHAVHALLSHLPSTYQGTLRLRL